MPPRPPLTLPFFSTGLYTNRQPLFHPLKNVGIQVISPNDAMLDGVNMEVTDQLTLKRRPPFVKYCTQQLAASETVKQFYSTRNLAGTVTVLADTNQNLYKVTPSTLTSLVSKGTSAQGFVQEVGDFTYYSNGVDFKKIDKNGTVTSWGIAAPKQAVSILGGRFWRPNGNYQASDASGWLVDSNGNLEELGAGANPGGASRPSWSTSLLGGTYDGSDTWTNRGPLGSWAPGVDVAPYTSIIDGNGNIQTASSGTTGATVPTWGATFGNITTDNTVSWENQGYATPRAFFGCSWVYAYRTIYGHLSTASPFVQNTGPILTAQTAPITAFSITSNVVTVTCANNFILNDFVVIQGLTTGTYLNNQTLKVLTATSGQFTASFTHANVGSTGDTGYAVPGVEVTGQRTTDSAQCNATATITNLALTSNVGTITATNTFSPGLWVTFSGLTTATWLNGQQVQINSATSSQFTFSFTHADYVSAGDTGTVTFNAVEIYRTADGGGIPYFCGAVTNPNSGSWTFTDSVLDSGLITTLFAPLAHLNDPPPGASGSVVQTGGTHICYWNGRMWMAVGNKVYFTSGPDCLNGIPEESFASGYVFTFPGNVTGLRALTGGVLVQMADEYASILGGPQTTAFYPDKFLSKTGALSSNCLSLDGSDIYVFTSGSQLFDINQTSRDETGFRIGDRFLNGQSAGLITASAWSPSTSSIAVHRNGYDAGVFVSNGVDSILRYGLNSGCWSTIYQPLLNGSVGVGVLNSVETSSGVWSLLLASSNAQDYIYYRNFAATTFQDNANSYPCSGVIGNIIITEPGQQLQAPWTISLYAAKFGSVPTIGFMPDEISTTGGASFSTVPNPVDEPALLPASKSILSKRYYLLANTAPTPLPMRHMQIKVDFGTDTVANELFSMAIGFDKGQAA